MIDLRYVKDAPSDQAFVASLAKQTGYWPVFSFLSSASNLVDVASVGVLGQKGASVVFLSFFSFGDFL